MKSIILTTLVVMFAFTSTLQAQFAVEAGYNSNSVRVKLLGASVSTSDGGDIYFGVSYDLSLGDKLSLQPAVLYSADAFLIPVSLKIPLGSTFNVMAGPSLLMISDGSTDDTGGFFNKNTIGYTAGLSVNVSDKFAIIVRYNSDLGNRIEDGGDDLSIKYAQFKAGLSYSF